MRLYRLDMIVLRVGPQPEELLQGTTSNTLDAPLTAFLDVFGRIVAVAFQCRNGEGILLAIGRQFYPRLMKHLNQYLLLCQAKIISEAYFVYYNLDDDYPATADEKVIQHKKGQVVLSRDDLRCDVSDAEFTAFRIANNIPLQGIDFDQEMALNVGEDFISFTKGCFVGQEIIARVKNRSKPPKRLVVRDGRFVMMGNGWW